TRSAAAQTAGAPALGRRSGGHRPGRARARSDLPRGAHGRRQAGREMKTARGELQVLDDAASCARETADRFVRAAEAAIRARGRFSVSLAGGSTPKAAYQLLRERALDWARVDVWFGDERCVPPDHKDSNYKMAREALLAQVPA